MPADHSLANVLEAWKLETEFQPNGEHHHKSDGGVDCWQLVKHLGGGAFGSVYKQRCRSGAAANTVRAVKHVSKRHSKFSERELMALITFSDMRVPEYAKHFVSCLGWFEDTEHLYIAMEFMEHGDLQRYVNHTILSEPEAAQIVSQVATGLQCMHRKGFVHRDLKPLNILVSHPGPVWHVKIADFGLSKNLNGTALDTHGIGTHGYVAPEQLDDGADSYTPAVDIFALGCVAYCLRTGRPPFQSPCPLMEYARDPRCFPIEPLDDSSAKCARFIQSAMAAKPDDRPSIEMVLGHPWLGEGSSNNQRPSLSSPEPSWGLSGAGSSSQWENTFPSAQATAAMNPEPSPATSPASSDPWKASSSSTPNHEAELRLGPQYFQPDYAAPPLTPPGSQRPTTGSSYQQWPVPPWADKSSIVTPADTPPDVGSHQQLAKPPVPGKKLESFPPKGCTGYQLPLENSNLHRNGYTKQPAQAVGAEKQQLEQNLRSAPPVIKEDHAAHMAAVLDDYQSKPGSTGSRRQAKTEKSLTALAVPPPPPRQRARPAGARPCEHWAPRKCQNLSKQCCECMDRRPITPDGRYAKHVDGLGDFDNGKRWNYYCPNCKRYGDKQWTTPKLNDVGVLGRIYNALMTKKS
ncbi:kinase-like domain-containing protein [Microdochium trichocladiopsis]|uniref:non-specific serine/threonine protein kinase n=1 Tax=Microdochium trichocladiopsis TaxID=1682393 RepID=A0A9P9BR22_9PEZI|nr:kinase-like domain-containing protein [Microdochium trichocladiopsis]KAH7031487.1 kinase-like domain-containing protein [Microdochium trichocladiopsis]